jgi:hypothetical protein
VSSASLWRTALRLIRSEEQDVCEREGLWGGGGGRISQPCRTPNDFIFSREREVCCIVLSSSMPPYVLLYCFGTVLLRFTGCPHNASNKRVARSGLRCNQCDTHSHLSSPARRQEAHQDMLECTCKKCSAYCGGSVALPLKLLKCLGMLASRRDLHRRSLGRGLASPDSFNAFWSFISHCWNTFFVCTFSEGAKRDAKTRGIV